MARTQRRRVANAPRPAAAGEPRRVRDNLPRPAAPPVIPGTARIAPRRSRNPFRSLGKLTPRFAGDIVSELRKVTWPPWEETRYLTVVVIIVSAAVGLLLGGVDLAFGWVVERLFF